MFRQLTILEVILAGVLCLFAIGTARGADSATTDRKHEYKIAIAHADAEYKTVKNACESEPSDGAAPPAWVSNDNAPTGSYPCRRYASSVSRIMS
jgi:hypothetical protein